MTGEEQRAAVKWVRKQVSSKLAQVLYDHYESDYSEWYPTKNERVHPTFLEWLKRL